MNLTLEQMQACSAGALRVWKEDGCFCFARMSEALEKAFASVNPAYFDRARSTTDCRLDLHTDSRILRVAATAEKPDGGCKIEIFIDGVPALFEAFTGQYVICMELPEGDKRVTIALPCHSVGRLMNVSVDEWAYVKPHSFDRKILFLGDSITQGWKSDHDAQTYTGNVARWFNADSLNWAVGGSCFHPACVEQTEFDPDVVIVGYGTNDYSARKDADQFVRFCKGHLEKVKEYYGQKKVFVITPIWRADHMLCKGVGTLLDCSALVRQEAEACGFVVLDGFKLFPHSREYMADGYLHPNDIGFSHYSMNLIKALTPYL